MQICNAILIYIIIILIKQDPHLARDIIVIKQRFEVEAPKKKNVD